MLVETVHAAVMYPTHKAYTRDTILIETPNITPQELAQRLDIPIGEAIVILKEIADNQKIIPQPLLASTNNKA
jgi:hypothetical protein